MIDSFRRRLSSGAADAPRGALFRSTEDLKSQVLKAYFRLFRPLGELTTAHLGESTAKRIEGPPIVVCFLFFRSTLIAFSAETQRLRGSWNVCSRKVSALSP
jgi:hypothetical protein